MTLTIPIPAELERKLRAETPDLDGAAKQAFLITLYREGKLHRKQLTELLGLDRWQIEAVLKKHNVTEDLPTIEEVREQVRVSSNLRKHG